MAHAPPCRAVNAGPAMAGRVPGQYAIKAPHRHPGPRRAIVVNGTLAGTTGRGCTANSQLKILIHR
jgi:hypothetical protein